MKKLLILFVCLFTLQTIARADDDKPIQVSQMPQKAQQFIKQHFAGNNIAMAKVESDFLQKSYDVIFTRSYPEVRNHQLCGREDSENRT